VAGLTAVFLKADFERGWGLTFRVIRRQPPVVEPGAQFLARDM
jgi:hypothetical protein